MSNTLYYGDNLPILRYMPSESVDLTDTFLSAQKVKKSEGEQGIFDL